MSSSENSTSASGPEAVLASVTSIAASKEGFRTNLETQTTEEKLVLLEEKFAALEEQHRELHRRVFAVRKNSLGSANEVHQLSPIIDGVSEDEEKDEKDSEKDKTKPPVDPEPGPTSRARIFVNKVDPVTGERKDQLPTDNTPIITKTTSRAFTLRKNIYNSSIQDNGGEIEIEDSGLWKLLKELLSDYPYHIFQGDPVTLYSPFEYLVLNWERLWKAIKNQSKKELSEEDKQARADLKLLLETISTSSGDPKLDKYFKSRASNKEQKTVTFETLWTIFPPGTVIYGRPFQGEDQIFVVQDNKSAWPGKMRNGRDALSWTLYCWTYDWNGDKFQRMSLGVGFESFEGHKPITTLPYYPFELHERYEEIKKILKERGEKYRKFCKADKGRRMFKYEGTAIFGKQGFLGIQGDDDRDDDIGSSVHQAQRLMGAPAPKSSIVSSTVMVDFESYFRYGPAIARIGSLIPDEENAECDCQDCKDNAGLAEMYKTRFDNAQELPWEDDQYMLCPPRVLGYILREKQWAQLQVNKLDNIPSEDFQNAYKSKLQLAGKDAGSVTKTLLMDLVKTHGVSTSTSKEQTEQYQMNDIVANKGKGLVILLYGPPGVGKTSTAETVAIAARKPLFSVSVADVGTKAKNVEANLAKIFDLATTWEAVLLIDEADVFLESRGRGLGSSTERNALVSVFLRVLEYYQGILILTTNQIAHFDVAIRSRIHIAIKYSALDHDQTIAIFRQFLEQLKANNLIKDMDDILDFLEEDVWKIGFDGRQIRNIMFCALGLVRAEKRDYLNKKDIKKIIQLSRDFKDDYRTQYEKYINEQKGSGMGYD